MASTDTGTLRFPTLGRRRVAASLPQETFFLPDFCTAPAALAVVLIVELVAVMYTIARQAAQGNFWLDLATSSLFLLWVGLGCAAALCRARPYLAKIAIPRASAYVLLMLLAIIGIVSELVYRLGLYWGADSSSFALLFPRQHGGFLLRNLAVGFIVSALALRYFYVAAEWKRSVQLEARASIRALQARIRPHFLFNSMNTIAALTRSDPKRAEEAVEDLADLFRANLSDARSQIPLKEELEVARIYQRIEQLRLGERLKVRWDINELPMRALVPSLLVQPLLENAVYHGIEALPEGGTVTVTGRCDGHMLQLEVSNPVPELPPAREREGHRLAIENIRQRLSLVWPGNSSVEVRTTEGQYRVTLTFPAEGAGG
jgi:two-component system sensor histidine kinase AlgZ